MKIWLLLIAALAIIFLALCDAVWPAEPRLLIDASGPAARQPGEPSQAAPDMLFTPCPLGPRNVPAIPDRKA